MILKRNRLVEVLNILSTCVGNKVMQVADYVHFRVDRNEQRLLLSTTDFNAFITVDYGDLELTTLEDVPDVFLVKFKQLYYILKNSTTEDVDISVTKTGQIKVVTNGVYELATYANIEEFPQASYQFQELGKWPVPVLQSAWKRAVIAVTEDVTKIHFQGVNYDGNFAATDGRRLAIASGEKEYNGDPILLMRSTGDILKHCKNEVSIGPNEQKTLFVIVCEEINMIASVRTIDAKFADYKKLLGRKVDGLKVTVSKGDLMSAASRLLIFTDQLFKVVSVKCRRNGDSANIELSINNKSSGNEVIVAKKIEGEMREFEYRYHLDNLIDGVAVTENSDDVVFNFQPDGKLWMEEKNFQYLLTMIQDQA